MPEAARIYLRHDVRALHLIAPTRAAARVSEYRADAAVLAVELSRLRREGELWEMTADAGPDAAMWSALGAGSLAAARFNFLGRCASARPPKSRCSEIALACATPKGEGIDAADHWARVVRSHYCLILHDSTGGGDAGRRVSPMSGPCVSKRGPESDRALANEMPVSRISFAKARRRCRVRISTHVRDTRRDRLPPSPAPGRARAGSGQ